MGAVDKLAVILAVAGDGPVETRGTARLFEAIAQQPVFADIAACPAARVPLAETALLQAEGRNDLHVRAGVLRCGSILAAQVTEIVVTGRIPVPARAALGITKSGRPMLVPGSSPLERALHATGVWREQHDISLTPDAADVTGARQPLLSSSLLLSPGGFPLAWTVERVYAEFLEAFPALWAGLPAVAHPAGVQRPIYMHIGPP
jgi:hypothetical protein